MVLNETILWVFLGTTEKLYTVEFCTFRVDLIMFAKKLYFFTKNFLKYRLNWLDIRQNTIFSNVCIRVQNLMKCWSPLKVNLLKSYA